MAEAEIARETPHLHRCTKCHGVDASVGPDGFCAMGETDCDGSNSGMFLCLISAVDDLFCGGHYERILPQDRRPSDPVFIDKQWRNRDPEGASDGA